MNLASATPTAPVATLKPPEAKAIDLYYGSSVGVSGSRVVISASGAQQYAGSAYLYDLSSATPDTPLAILSNPTPAPNDFFGSPVAIDGTTVVAGASQDDTVALNKGAAYVFSVASNDVTTYPPTLPSPAPGSTHAGNIAVRFFLPEPAMSGSVRLTFDSGTGTVREVTLASSQEAVGLRTFSLPAFNLGASPEVASVSGGTSLPDGKYTVTLAYQDVAGNPLATTVSTDVTIYSSPTPAGYYSASGYGPGTAASPGYFVPLPGSTAQTPNPAGTWSHQGSRAVRSAPTLRDPANYIVGPIFSATLQANATTDLGTIPESQETSFVLKNLSQDLGAADTLTDLGITSVSLGGPDAGLAQVLQAPENGSVLHEGQESQVRLRVQPGSSGKHSATLTFRTDVGAAPGQAWVSYSFTFNWRSPLNPTVTPLFQQGAEVPTAGSDPRIHPDAKWTALGAPAINSKGLIAFLGRWSAPDNGNVPAQRGTGLFVDGKLIMEVGDPVPNPRNTLDLPTDAIFTSFKDPIIADDGSGAVLATIRGRGVTATNNLLLLYFGTDGELTYNAQPVARRGESVTESGEILQSIAGVAVAPGGTVAWRGTLNPRNGKRVSTSTNIPAVWSWSATTGTARELLREGKSPASGLSALAGFKTLIAGAGTPGAGRGWFFQDPISRQPWLTAQVTYRGGGASCIMINVVTGVANEVVYTPAHGEAAPAGASYFTKIGLPSFAPHAPSVMFRATTDKQAVGIWQINPLDYISDTQQSTSSVVLVRDVTLDGFNVVSMQDPVVSPDGSVIALNALIGGTGVKGSSDNAIICAKATSSARVVAREGSQAAECPSGARWKAFTSLAAMGGQTINTESAPSSRGVLFTATLLRGTGGVDTTNDQGLWGDDSNGILRLLLRKGQILGNKKVKAFQVLQAVSGSPGVTRAFNTIGELAALATFTDGSKSVVRITVP